MNQITFARNMDIYTTIDNVHDYEITNCIAYEMAIRNKELLKLLYDLHFCTSKEDEDKIRKTLDNDFFFNNDCIKYFNLNFHFIYASLFAPELDLDLIDEKKILTTYADANSSGTSWKFTQHDKNGNKSKVNLNDEFTGFKIKKIKMRNYLQTILCKISADQH